MKKELGVFTGKTVEDAKANALKSLHLSAEDVEIEILEKGKVTFLGIGAIKAKIKIYAKEADSKKEEEGKEEVIPVAEKEAVKDKQTADSKRAVVFLQGLLELLQMQAQPVLVKEEEKIEINLETEESHKVIGKKGIILDSLQSLAGAVANTGNDKYKRVVVDCNNYRAKRDETLAHVAQKTADKAVRLGKKIRLEPMSAYERRIIHASLADSKEVKTSSEGKEPRRYVVVIPNEMKSFKNKKGDRKYSDKPYNRDAKRSYNSEKRERKPYRQYSEEEKRERSKVGEGTGMGGTSNGSYKKNASMVFGTFLGNSLKNEENE